MTNKERVERIAIGVGFFSDKPRCGLTKSGSTGHTEWSEAREMTEIEVLNAAFICIKYLAKNGKNKISCLDGTVTFDYKSNLQEEKQ